ncbi:RNA methyltransferase [Streptomyces griseoviridis]|uniref:tRNA G18 (Ribose-2'-O)-methylase SpoU n=3 Tax=Streptomyces TaxID=1883 RepID=A0ABT9LAL1_STRGD|nr:MULTISPECIES: RNA methyltransferase [Streptomyces]MDP9680754.1 tRNA G18 (ribose-2'-O)-methylase SpoU [Streptomyces griseoviridis]GGS35186.1 rRNA methyltransferase [Streptomyces niveoruber]GGS97873.1 rRNA methyltransferase [Streptomyces griseoviridis]GGU42494.1 rRNA methyltransferase [Streptomyces daghestanicus]GHI28718.1 rRNA methyltransferase [Streptomyces daghestanicus]
MAAPVTVTDPADPRLHDYTDLTDVALRRRREPAEGLFIAEGEKVIRRAGDAGYAMRSMLLSEKWVDVMRDVIEETTAPVYVVSPAVAEQVTGYHVHRGALASMHRRRMPAPTALLAGARRIAVFEDIVDHANVGAAFRNAAALGVDAVLLTPRCADPLYRRSVKVSMGNVFQVPWTRLESWPHDLGTLRAEGFTVAAFCLSDRAITLDELAARDHDRLALLFGTEGDGLTPGALDAADVHVRIPMDAGVDSLNVAAASAVAFYATRPRPA